MHYPTAAEPDAMGATLERDVCLCSDKIRAWLIPAPPVSTFNAAQRREYDRKRPRRGSRRGLSGKRIG